MPTPACARSSATRSCAGGRGQLPGAAALPAPTGAGAASRSPPRGGPAGGTAKIGSASGSAGAPISSARSSRATSRKKPCAAARGSAHQRREGAGRAGIRRRMRNARRRAQRRVAGRAVCAGRGGHLGKVPEGGGVRRPGQDALDGQLCLALPPALAAVPALRQPLRIRERERRQRRALGAAAQAAAGHERSQGRVLARAALQ